MAQATMSTQKVSWGSDGISVEWYAWLSLGDQVSVSSPHPLHVPRLAGFNLEDCLCPVWFLLKNLNVKLARGAACGIPSESERTTEVLVFLGLIFPSYAARVEHSEPGDHEYYYQTEWLVPHKNTSLQPE